MSRWPLKPRAGKTGVVWGMDAQLLAWRPTDAQESVLVDTHEDGAIQALVNVTPGQVIDVIVANDLAAHWVQHPPASAKSFSELRLVAQARCAHLYGGTPQDWLIAADWDAKQPFVCAGLHRANLQSLQEHVTQHGCRVRLHTAWSLLAEKRAHVFPSDGWVGLRSPRRIMLWQSNRGKVTRLLKLAADTNAREESAAELVAQSLRIEMPGDDISAELAALRWFDMAKPQELACNGVVAAELVASIEAVAALGLDSLCGATRR